MRRFVTVVASAALLMAPFFAVAEAAGLPQPGQFDLGAQLMLQLFGENSDDGASFAAEHGDRTSESPLRDLALAVKPAFTKPSSSVGIGTAFAENSVALRDLSGGQDASLGDTVRLSPASSALHFSIAPSTDESSMLEAPNAHFTAAYQPVPPVPSISPGPGTLAFTPPQIDTTNFTPSATSQLDAAAQSALTDSSQGGTNFEVRAGKHSVNLNLSSSYAHAGPSDAQSFLVTTPDANAAWQLPALSAPLAAPNSTDANRLSLGAGLSVPVVRGLTLNVNYDAQRLYGNYGLPGLLNLDTINNTYGGKLTFTIPRTSSSLSIGAYQDRLEDSILSINGQTQTREDVNFTVKF